MAAWDRAEKRNQRLNLFFSKLTTVDLSTTINQFNPVFSNESHAICFFGKAFFNQLIDWIAAGDDKFNVFCLQLSIDFFKQRSIKRAL